MTDDDFNCSSACVGNLLLLAAASSSSSPPPSVATAGLPCAYAAAPFDHDYAKCKTLRRQQWQDKRHEERQADGTVPPPPVPPSPPGVLDLGLGLFNLSISLSPLSLSLHWDRKSTGGRCCCCCCALPLRLWLFYLSLPVFPPMHCATWDVATRATWLLVI